jgi:hypothetical protein
MNRFSPSVVSLSAFLWLLLASSSHAQQDLQPPKVDVTGTWSILSESEEGRESMKTVEFIQEGNQLRGTFKGPNQSGGISGFVSGKHIRFITLTPNQLKFRGKVDGNTISGMVGFRGKTGEWTATRLGPPPDATPQKQ